MPKRTRATTGIKCAHSGGDTEVHRRHAREAAALREQTSISVQTVKGPSPTRDFSPFVTPRDFIWNGRSWKACDDREELAKHLRHQLRLRSFYYAPVQRNGRKIWMKRKAGTPIEIHTMDLAPWVSDYLLESLTSGAGGLPQLLRIEEAWLAEAHRFFHERREVLTCSRHADTSDLHWDYAVSRFADGRRIGAAGLGCVGPWCVAVDRQIRAGAELAPLKAERIERAIAVFTARHGRDVVPFDVMLARTLDSISFEAIGPELAPWIARYGEQVPTLERAHTAAALAMLDSAREKLVAQLGPVAERLPASSDRDYRPTPGPEMSP